MFGLDSSFNFEDFIKKYPMDSVNSNFMKNYMLGKNWDIMRIKKSSNNVGAFFIDVMPMQVQIEAQVISVALKGDLQYGVSWFFDHAVNSNAAGNLPVSDRA